jgi:hypothetical protein
MVKELTITTLLLYLESEKKDSPYRRISGVTREQFGPSIVGSEKRLFSLSAISVALP